MIELEQDCSSTAVYRLQLKTAMPDDDPLLCKASLEFCATFYPLGFAVEITTNSPEVLDAAAESWGTVPQRFSYPPLRVRVGVADFGPAPCPPAPVVRAQRHLLSIIADNHNHAICDLREGFAFVWVDRGAMEHRSYLRYHLLESPVLSLLSAAYVVPIHAACVSFNDCGMLLCGPSGVGKSTLAYACARAGWTYTSDDASQLLLHADRPCILADSRRFRFRPSARALFPELRGHAPTPRSEGKPSIEILSSELPGILASDEATAHCAIFLNRQPSAAAELLPYPGDHMDYFRKDADVFPPEAISHSPRAALEYLSHIKAYELRYSDLPHAVEQLERLARGSGAQLQ